MDLGTEHPALVEDVEAVRCISRFWRLIRGWAGRVARLLREIPRLGLHAPLSAFVLLLTSVAMVAVGPDGLGS